MNKKPIVAMDLSTTGKGGGPFTSTSRTMNSGLTKKYKFKTIHYKTELGNGISIKRIKDLTTQIKKINPDIVHFTGLQLSGFHMAVACKLAGVKNTVVTVRGFSGDALYFNKIKKAIITYLLEPFTLMLSKRVIGVSNYVISRRMVRLLAKKKRTAIYNFPPKFDDKFDQETSFRESLGLDLDDILVVTVARINKDKGYHIFDEAILKFKDQKNVKFIVVGNGSYLPEMEEKLDAMIQNKQVFLLGYRNDISYILHSCNVFVLPTLHETLSVALLEASQYGLALVASKTGGVPEIVEHDYNGKLVPTGDVQKLYEAIGELLNDKKKIDTFGKNAKLRILKKFSNVGIERKLDKVYQSILQDYDENK